MPEDVDLPALWWADPEAFARDVLGKELWSKQLEIAAALRDNPVVAVRSCHAAGKSFVSAEEALRFLYSHLNSVVWSTAPTGRQVYNILWREIRAAHANARVPLGGDLLKTRLDLGEQWFAYGFSTDRGENFQGVHASSSWILGVIDEASGVSDEIFNAAESTLTSSNGRLLMVGNANAPVGRFYESFKLPDVFKIKIAAYDTPNFIANGIRTAADLIALTDAQAADARIVAPHLITVQWAKRLLNRVHGNVLHPDFLVRVEAEFPEHAENVLITLALVENAQNREVEVDPENTDKAIGVDPASDGVNPDRSAVIVRHGKKVLEKHVFIGLDSIQLAGKVAEIRARFPGFWIKVDSIGIGKGVYDQLRHLGREGGWASSVLKVEFGGTPVDEGRYKNLRAEAWGNMADWLRDGDIPNDDDFREAANVQYRYTSRGQLELESKDEIKKRNGGRSPDVADALAISLVGKGTKRVRFVTAG